MAMTRTRQMFLTIGVALAFDLAARPQTAVAENGMWQPVDQNGVQITGKISFGSGKLTIGSTSVALTRLRELTAAELADPNAGDPGHAGKGWMYAVHIPASERFLNQHELCGGRETTFATTYVLDRALQLTFFTGKTPPDLKNKALEKTPQFCGTFVYVR